MASSDPLDQPTPKNSPVSEAAVLLRMLGTDPWMRYDLFAARAWDAAEKATQLALSTGPPISSDDVVFDPRVAALFHAAEVAKELSEAVNPLTAISGAEFGEDLEASQEREVIFEMEVEPEDTD